MEERNEFELEDWEDFADQVPEAAASYGPERSVARHVRTEPAWDGGHRRGGWRVWRMVLIPLTAVMLAAVVVLGVSFTYAQRVARLTTIYPNVTVNGVDVGGMTVAEAAAALGDDPARYDNAAVTVNFPTGDSVTVTAQQLGLQAMDGTAFARAAYSYGRGGSMLAQLRAYRACQAQPVALSVDGAEPAPIDENVIAGILASAAETVNGKLRVIDYQVGQDQITLVKNDGTAQVDVQALAAQVRTAFEQENYAPIDYQVPEGDGSGAETSQTEVDALLERLYNDIHVEPVDAHYDQATGGVTPEVQGVRFDMDQARAMWAQAQNGQTVTIPILREDPAVTAESLSNRLFADVLAEKSTTLSGSTSARINNITLAAAAMNGVILQPGEEFNYNQCLGQRTAEKGYQSAGAFSGGKHVMSIGGGICQGSSTLYYCALKANLTITERWCHQFLVSYLPRGMDATVSWGWPEFKFVNSRQYPIKIEAYVSGGYLTIRILGTDVDGSYVDITNDTWEDATHYYAQTYRNVYDKNGNLISSQKEAYSSYDKEEALAAAATPTPAPQVTPEPVVQEPVVQEPAVQEPVVEAPVAEVPAPEEVAPPPPVVEVIPEADTGTEPLPEEAPAAEGEIIE